jgi:hypothetical protein
MRAVIAFAVMALIACWFWWQEEEKWCGAFYEGTSPVAATICLPLSPLVALGIVLISGVAILRMKLRKRQT